MTEQAETGTSPDAGASPASRAASAGAEADVEAGVVRGAAGMPEPPTTATSPEGGPSLDELEEAMRDVVDPELGINVVDLGLVYDIRVDERVALVDMTLTSAACPLTDVIEDQTRSALVGSSGEGLVEDVKINWVWMPPWGPDKITEDGREQLRALGFTV